MFSYIELWEQPLGLAVYETSLLVAAVIVVALGIGVAVARGLPRRGVVACIVAMSLAAVAGARLLHGATNMSLYEDDSGRFYRAEAGDFSLFGGMLLASVVGVAVCRVVKINPWALADALAPAIGLGIAIVRLGCFFNGCCFGRMTTLPWAVKYPAGSPAHIHQIAEDAGTIFQGCQPVHPTQLYELLAALVASLIAVWFLCRQSTTGTAALAALIWFTAFRWLNDALRDHSPTLATPEFFYPLIYGTVIVGASLTLINLVNETDKMSETIS